MVYVIYYTGEKNQFHLMAYHVSKLIIIVIKLQFFSLFWVLVVLALMISDSDFRFQTSAGLHVY